MPVYDSIKKGTYNIRAKTEIIKKKEIKALDGEETIKTKNKISDPVEI